MNNLAKTANELEREHKAEVDILKDLAYKKDYDTNSWFYIGHYNTKGHVLNFLYHVMVCKVKLVTMGVVCLSITDETTGEYYSDMKVLPAHQMKKEKDRFLVSTDRTSMSGDLEEMVLKAEMECGTVDIRMTPSGYPIFNGGTGKTEMLGTDIYQYSLPSLESTGSITVNNTTYPVSGLVWFDRQGENNMPETPTWGWMDLNMDNGDALSLWFTYYNGEEKVWATLLEPDGKQRVVPVESIINNASDYWKSSFSGFEYPTRWRVIIPELDADLTVSCTPKEQELECSFMKKLSHYEAASSVSGRYKGKEASGYTYVELTGEWHENMKY